MKKVFPNLISSQQTAYVAQRYINESNRLICNLLSVTKKLKIKGYLVTTDIEKAFDSLDHTFLISTLEKFGFGKAFRDWIKIFLNEQESFVINGGITAKYFKLEKGAIQANPVSVYLFILCLEILFLLIKNNKNIKGIKMFENTFLYTAYADDSTFFLKDKNSIKELLNKINYFSSFMSLKPNLSKCEVAGIGALNGAKVAICGIKCIDLMKEAIKILRKTLLRLRFFFSYDKDLQLENNFRKIILNIERILKLWRQRNLTLEGKIIIFKTLALSKVTFFAEVLVIPNQIIDGLQQIQKDFLQNSSSPKEKHETICKDFQYGGLKNIDKKSKTRSLQCFWIKKLYDEVFQEWKIIPLTLIKNIFGECFYFPP